MLNTVDKNLNLTGTVEPVVSNGLTVLVGVFNNGQCHVSFIVPSDARLHQILA